MIYSIVAYGDAVLKKMCTDVDPTSPEIKQLTEDMFETMYNAHGVGLAAPQIGKAQRLFIVDGESIDDEDMIGFKKVFINPTIEEEWGDDWAYEEGCLSIPSIREEVSRPESLSITYYDLEGKKHTEEYDGMKARVIQHEYDHIEGILFTDYLSGFKKRLIKNKLTNISRGKISIHYRMRFPNLK